MNTTHLALSAATLLLAASCSSTEIIEPAGSGPEAAKCITLSLSAPAAATRASADHKLRYTASLYANTNGSGKFTFLQKKQAIDNAGSTIVFEGVDEGKYTIILFADYIPSAATPDEKGAYPDNYYDTSANDDIKLKNVSIDMLNNDNYDCFAAAVVLTKEAEERHETVTLTRAAAKVRMVAEKQSEAEITGLSIKKFSTNLYYKISSGNASEPFNYPTSQLSKPWQAVPSDPQNGELFYFYTFAPGASQNNGKGTGLMYFTFTTEAEGCEPVTTEIVSGKVIVKQNYITTVKGDFLPQLPDDPATRSDRIIVDLSADTAWK